MRTKLLRVVLAIGVPVLVLGFLPGRAAAATQTVPLTFAGSGGNTDVLSVLGVCDECAPDSFFTDPTDFINTWGFGANATVQAQASWADPSPVGLQYSATNLRQGSTLDLADTLTPGAGTLTVNYSVSGRLGLYGSPDSGSLTCAVVTVTPTTCNHWVPTTSTLTFGPISASDTIPCTMPLPGDSPRDCSKTKSITLWNTDLFDFVSVEVDLILDETVHVTGSGVASVRVAVISGGQAIPNNPLEFAGLAPSTLADPIAIGCNQPVGSDLLYSLTNNSYTADPATYSGDLKLRVAASAFGIGGDYTTPPLVGTSGADLGPIAMGAPDQQVDLGPVLKNNVPPTANAGGPYSGVEGTPVTFNAGASASVCGLDSLTEVWNFSDGGVAFGLTPQHTFRAPGIYSGLLTTTDPDGNVATQAFSVTIGNLPPVANAGPNMASEWGVPVTLNGSAVDPGTDEQPFLAYSWSFGDGSPSASGGASVNHVYTTPGSYTATFTACDPELACSSSTTQVVVVKRATTMTYTGPNKSTPSKNITMTASLVDDLGQPVAGRTVLFTLGSQSISATTNASGVASATFKLNQKQGAHTARAAFAGDTKYVLSSNSQTFTIGP